MSNYKESQDQSPTYLQRQSQAWCKVHKERVRSIIKQKKLNKDAKLIYTGLLTYFHDGGGVLIESKDRVAKSLGFEKADLDYCIGILEREGWLEIAESGAIFEPVVYKYITGNEHPDDAESGRIQSNLVKYGRILPNSPGQTSALDKIRLSSSGGLSQPEERKDFNYQTEKETGIGEGSLGLPSRFPFLSEKDVEYVRTANLDLDWSNLWSKFLESNEKTLVKIVNRKWLETFVAGYINRLEAATAEPKATKLVPKPEESAELPKLKFKNCDLSLQLEGVSEKDRKEYGWFIADKKIADWGLKSPFVRSCRIMPSGNFEECRKYLLKLTAGNKVPDWDVKDALLRFSGDDSRPFYVLFAETNWDDDGFDPIGWSGIKTAEEEAETEEAASS